MTLVTGVLRNDAETDRRVRIENVLDAPVLPPRANGVAEEGWDDAGYECHLPAGETVAFGYACRADPRAEPCRVARDDPAERESRSPTAADAVRELGDPRPPAAGVPSGDGRGADLPTAVEAWLETLTSRFDDGTATAADHRTLAVARERLRSIEPGAP